MERAAREIWKYGDSSSHDLRHALAETHGVAPENVLVGEGIDGILGNLVRLTVAPGDHVVTSDGAYPTFNYHVAGFGGTLHKVPYVNDHEDPETLFTKAAEVGAKLVYLANPDNPMGTWHAGAALARMIDAHLPEGCLLVLDEAYIEFAPEGTAPDIAPVRGVPADPECVSAAPWQRGLGLFPGRNPCDRDVPNDAVRGKGFRWRFARLSPLMMYSWCRGHPKSCPRRPTRELG
jgi:histidinol-phosphate aminotransferase